MTYATPPQPLFPQLQRVRSVAQTIGNTPLVKLSRIAAHLSPNVEIYAKLEYFNPSGSIKDRPAAHILRDAFLKGHLTPDKTLIEATTGNFGASYAMLGAAFNIQTTLVMPQGSAPIHQEIAKAYGAHIVHSPSNEGLEGAHRHLKTMLAQDTSERYFHPNSHANPFNPLAHAQGTASEIWDATSGRVTHIVTGVGTAGTLVGTARGLKHHNPAIQAVAAISKSTNPQVPGWSTDSTNPTLYDPTLIDAQLCINADTKAIAAKLADTEGLTIGPSGCAALIATLEVAQHLDQGVLVTLFPDHADRYVY